MKRSAEGINPYPSSFDYFRPGRSVRTAGLTFVRLHGYVERVIGGSQ
jgi:hypothetical protein